MCESVVFPSYGQEQLVRSPDSESVVLDNRLLLDVSVSYRALTVGNVPKQKNLDQRTSYCSNHSHIL